MVVHDNTYSRIIAWLKILLPLLALGILSTLFLVARTINPAQELPFADVDVDELAREQRIGKPNYSGITSDGSAISLSANSARPDPDDPNNMTGEQVTAAIDLARGNRITVASDRMRLDNTAGVARLRKDVVVTTDDGYQLRSDQIDIKLNEVDVRSDSITTVTAPIGTLSADSFALSRRNESAESYVLVFKGHIKLVYDPNE